MIYLLAILWFASGFFGWAFLIVVDGKDFKIPSEDFIAAILAGLLAPLVWAIFISLAILKLVDVLPGITHFKARNK